MPPSVSSGARWGRNNGQAAPARPDRRCQDRAGAAAPPATLDRRIDAMQQQDARRRRSARPPYGRKKELNEDYSKYLSREAPLYKTDESFSFFAGLYGDNLMIDEGTSPEMRRIQLYNLTKREFLYRGIYFNTIEHVNENEIYVCAEPPLTGITNRGLTGKSFNFRLGKYFGDKIIHTSFDKLKGAIQEGDLSEADALFSNRILNLTTGKIRETNIIQVTFTEGGGRLFR